MTSDAISRRRFIRAATGTAAATAILQTSASAQQSVRLAGSPRAEAVRNQVQLPQISAPATEPAEKAPGPFLPVDRRIGYAIVGLGHLSVNQILPAFARSKYCRPVALVSGDRAKALKLAAQYGIPESNITDYASFERLASMPGVDAIYIVLPNSMHREYVERSAKIGKHILCEKPMATSVADCEAMIAACARANLKLMLAYRQQYEPMNRFLRDAVAGGKLGRVRSIVASNSQNQGDPAQWRLKRALAGGGPLPDVGIYCINAARFLSGEEPTEVFGSITQRKDDPRFSEVESQCSAILKFSSGLVATFSSAYDVHRSAFLRLEGDVAVAEMDPAFGYAGSRIRFRQMEDGKDTERMPSIAEEDQFALEMDHFAECVATGTAPHTPGEEGLQDQRIIEAIYQSASSGKLVRVAQPMGPTRGAALPKEG